MFVLRRTAVALAARFNLLVTHSVPKLRNYYPLGELGVLAPADNLQAFTNNTQLKQRETALSLDLQGQQN